MRYCLQAHRLCLVQSELSRCHSSPRTVPISTAWDGDCLTCGHLCGSSLQQELPTLLVHLDVTLQEPGGDRRTLRALCEERPDGEERRAVKGRPRHKDRGMCGGDVHISRECVCVCFHSFRQHIITEP